MTRTKVVCSICGREISKSNVTKHIKAHKNHPERCEKEVIHLDHDDLFCKYCGKECKNKNSVIQHEIRCASNPNRKDVIRKGFNGKGKLPWNKGLSKETDERVLKASIKSSISKKGKPGHAHTEEFKKKQRDNALRNHLGGFNMCRGIYYNGIKLDSSYEVSVAESLDSNCVKWERPGRFLYHFNGVEHYYTPDFYLPEYNVYLDPKNDYLIDNINPRLGYKDLDKIKQVEKENNIKVIVLNKEHLDWESIKNLLP